MHGHTDAHAHIQKDNGSFKVAIATVKKIKLMKQKSQMKVLIIYFILQKRITLIMVQLP